MIGTVIRIKLHRKEGWMSRTVIDIKQTTRMELRVIEAALDKELRGTGIRTTCGEARETGPGNEEHPIAELSGNLRRVDAEGYVDFAVERAKLELAHLEVLWGGRCTGLFASRRLQLGGKRRRPLAVDDELIALDLEGQRASIHAW